MTSMMTDWAMVLRFKERRYVKLLNESLIMREKELNMESWINEMPSGYVNTDNIVTYYKTKNRNLSNAVIVARKDMVAWLMKDPAVLHVIV